MIPTIKKNKQLFFHIIIWIAVVFTIANQLFLEKGEFPVKFLLRIWINIVLFYVNYLFLVPRLLLKKKTLQYTLCAVLIIITPVFLNKVILTPIHQFDRIAGEDELFLFKKLEIGISILFNVISLIIGTSLRIYEEWKKNEKKNQEIESKRVTSELLYLKSQLNPHFLFNSLNSIYSLTTKKSDIAPEAVITLSELMRYMLYQTDSEFVLLHQELDYIQNYIKLQRLRIANNEDVNIQIHGSILNQKIKPLLLISFIENAFKYGTDFKGNTEVKIEIYVHQGELQFSCINLIGNRKKDYQNSGIGLQNTKERMQLLYPDKHWLMVKEENNRFIVELTLKLT
ncbi:sensor histidine kinase [Aquimarina sp. TRL1]|uniref:sensor histidine kinase n=1 Tax=Aquimarina sp. (strain TRL1) TaxID=2736252 RepID=UPI00158C25B4|nr:sensor histidine kinase [Aquimarina sp. TRL1]QKX06608.1 sensor histidine kinase [Aquimarina sp. TRL1]